MAANAFHGAPHVPTLAALRNALTRLQDPRQLEREYLALGPSEIHGRLGGPGVLCGALHEVMAALYGDRPAALGFVLALVALALSRRFGLAMLVMTRRTLAAFGRPYGCGLRQLGVDGLAPFVADDQAKLEFRRSRPLSPT